MAEMTDFRRRCLENRQKQMQSAMKQLKENMFILWVAYTIASLAFIIGAGDLP